MTTSDPLTELLGPERLTAVVDIGANPIDTDPPYKRMLVNRLCTLVGFEPQAEGLANLNAMKSDLETYLPYAVGDGGKGILKICHAPGMTSLLTPEPRVLDCFPGFTEFGRVVSELPIETRTLDGISEITHLDFLKIDVQGGELSVFRGGGTRLSNAIAIQAKDGKFTALYVDLRIGIERTRFKSEPANYPAKFREAENSIEHARFGVSKLVMPGACSIVFPASRNLAG